MNGANPKTAGRPSTPKFRWDRKYILYGLLILAIPSLALLQYRWIGQLTEREYDHSRHVLELSGAQIVDGYSQEMQSIKFSLEGRPAPQHFPGPSRPLDIRNMIPDKLLEQFHASAKDYLLHHIRENALASILDTTNTLSYFDERYSFHLERYNNSTATFEPIRDTTQQTGRFDPNSASARITPRDILVHVIDTQLATSPGTSVSYFISTSIRQEYFQRILDSLVRRYGQSDSDENQYAVAVALTTVGPNPLASSGNPIRLPVRPSPIYESASIKDWSSPDVVLTMISPLSNNYRRTQVKSASTSTTNLPSSPSWSLLLKNTSGSLASIVARYRLHNLLISFGILLTLGASIVLLVIGNNRAARLAEQQVRFLAGISHELRTPIAVIRSASENLSDGLITNPEKLRTYGRMIKRETDNLWEMIERVLQYSSINSAATLSMRAVDLNELVRTAVLRCDPIARSADVQVVTHLADQPLLAVGDTNALRSCIENILVNAIKYGRSEKPVEVYTRLDHSRKSTFAAITVKDHGLGIPIEEQGSIFEPFFRGSNASLAHARGNGLGLSLVKNAIGLHNGYVTFDSAPNFGSTFTLLIPLQPGASSLFTESQNSSLVELQHLSSATSVQKQYSDKPAPNSSSNE